MRLFRTGGSLPATTYGRFVRGMRLYFGLLIVFVLVLNIPFSSGSLLHARGPMLWAVMGVAVAMAAGGSLVLFPLRRRLDHALKADPRLACPWCTFDLSRSAPEGRCPECAAAYEHSAVQRYWSALDATFTRAKKTGMFPGDRKLVRASGLAGPHDKSRV